MVRSESAPNRTVPLAKVDDMALPVSVLQADITTLDVDAIVNAANEALLPGGGVCGAIHRAAGPDLANACQSQAPCPTGQARITPGFALPARYVIHTVGPVWHGGTQNEARLLADCYRASLDLAFENDLGSVAFPAISTGIFGFPADQAARIAVNTVCDVLGNAESSMQVILCCFDRPSSQLHENALKSIQNQD